MKKVLFVLSLIIIVASIAEGNNYAGFTKAAFNNDSIPEFKMKQYWLVFLHKGSVRAQDSLSSARIQAAHISNIERLAKEGKIIMAGPMGYDRDLRGIFIMDGKDSSEIAGYIKTDSAIITGRLRFEIHPWWAQKGTYEFK